MAASHEYLKDLQVAEVLESADSAAWAAFGVGAAGLVVRAEWSVTTLQPVQEPTYLREFGFDVVDVDASAAANG